MKRPRTLVRLLASFLLTLGFGLGLAPACDTDGGTGDPTGTAGDGDGDGDSRDIGDALAAIPGMTVAEEAAEQEGYRFFRLTYEQPVDHDAPAAETFAQHLTLLFRGRSAPTVLATDGYYTSFRPRRGELASLLNANQLAVEHRFFAPSVPASGDWTKLTIEQSARDHHRIVEAIRPLFSAPWVNTGASKGGMTAIYHRRFFPDDVDGTVAYVAPHSYAARDPRYAEFFADIGNESCRGIVHTLQRELLSRRAAMLEATTTYAEARGMAFERIGGAETAFEAAVLEVEWYFWQYAGVSSCQLLPGTDASDSELFDAMNNLGGLFYASDQFFDIYGPYYYQAHTELGYPSVARAHVADLLETNPINLEEGLPPADAVIAFDAGPMADVAQWLAADASEIMLIYGEHDPYTAGAYDLGDAADSHRFDVPDGNHGASLQLLPEGEQADAFAVLERWTGVSPLLRGDAREATALTGLEDVRQRAAQQWLARRRAELAR